MFPLICPIIVQYFILLINHLQYVSARLFNIIVQYIILPHGSGLVKMLSDTDATCAVIDLATCLKKIATRPKNDTHEYHNTRITIS
jgi:hypothetical protein